MSRPMPRQPVPDLSIDTLAGRRWTFDAVPATHFWMLVFYRGLHCPVCRRYLTELDGMLEKFAAQGVSVLALSGDTAERATQARDTWPLPHLDIGYGLPLAEARRWGLYVSSSRGKTSIGIEEPAQFSEPGLFLVRPDRTLYWAAVQTMPFARPHFADILGGVEFALKNDYPARGEA